MIPFHQAAINPFFKMTATLKKMTFFSLKKMTRSEKHGKLMF